MFYDSESGYETAEQYENFHENQIYTADSILQEFNDYDKGYVLVQAQMQTGKTGLALFTSFELLRINRIERVYIISGMSDIHLKDQWITKIQQHQNDYMWLGNMDGKLGKKGKILNNKINDIVNNVYFNSELKTLNDIEQFKDSLIIWDEPHYGADENSQVHKLFQRLNIQSILEGNECKLLKTYNISLLSLDATRGVEDSILKNNPNTSKYWGRCYLTPGHTYKGIIDYYNNRQIHKSYELCDKNKSTIIQIINKYRIQNKYMIIRAIGKQESYIQNLCNDIGIPIRYFNLKNQTNFDFIEPEEFTVVLIKGKLRLGKELNKQYISAVYESSIDMKNDTLLQGLMGRVCGYNISNDIDIYIPRNESEIEELIEEFNLVNKHTASAGLSNTKFVPKRKRLKKTHIQRHFTIPQKIIYECDEDNNNVYNLPDSNITNWQIKQLLDKLDLSMYSNDQQTEIELLKRNTNIRTITTIRNTHTSNGELTYSGWNGWYKYYIAWQTGQQFTQFNQNKNIIITRVIKPIDQCPDLEPNTCMINFMLNNKNKNIDNPFPLAKKGEMHTPYKNILQVNTESILQVNKEQYYYYDDDQCILFKSDIHYFISTLFLHVNEFEKCSENTKIIYIRNVTDNKYHNKNIKSISDINGIILHKNLKALKDMILQKYTYIVNVEAKRKNNKLLTSQGLYTYKEIILYLNKP